MSEKQTIGAIVFGPNRETIWRDTSRMNALTQHVTNTSAHACNCIGPQPGQTKCPCVLRGEMEQAAQMLRDGVVINGQRYRLVRDDQP